MTKVVQEACLRSVFIEVNGGEATGVIVRTGYVLTNFHCLTTDSGVQVDGKEADVVFVLPQDDLALLSVETRAMEDIVLSEAQVTESVFYVGNPGSIRNAVVFGRVIARYKDDVLCDNPCQCGASGSGLYNLEGHMVGLVEAIRQPSKDDDHFGSAFLVAVCPATIRNFLRRALVVVEALEAYAIPHLLLTLTECGGGDGEVVETPPTETAK